MAAKYKFYTINEPGKPETVQSFNTITAARNHALRNSKKHRATYSIWGHMSVTKKPEFLEHYMYSPITGMDHYKMRTTSGRLL